MFDFKAANIFAGNSESKLNKLIYNVWCYTSHISTCRQNIFDSDLNYHQAHVRRLAYNCTYDSILPFRCTSSFCRILSMNKVKSSPWLKLRRIAKGSGSSLPTLTKMLLLFIISLSSFFSFTETPNSNISANARSLIGLYDYCRIVDGKTVNVDQDLWIFSRIKRRVNICLMVDLPGLKSQWQLVSVAQTICS